jgi:predicted ATPase/class 3 adenylate cyclase
MTLNGQPLGSTTGVSLPTGTVTFLFTDIEGSTHLVAALAERYTSVLETHGHALRTAIADHGGTEVGTEGDAFFAAFPSAVEAVTAAVEAQRTLARTDWPKGGVVRVRMGLHTGEGRLGGDSYVGLDVHRAARIAAAGHGGQVLLSDTARALVATALPEGVYLRDLGVHRLKDLETPMRIWQLEIDGLPASFPALSTPNARPGNLPPQLTTFIGRDRELREVLELFESNPLVTLTGPGGTGKTRLALQAGGELMSRLPDGVFFVDLAPLRDAALVPLAVAQALGLSVDPGGDPLNGARSYLRDRALLLIVDNFEHVAQAAAVITELLASAAGLRVLVTSRTPLGIYGEQEFEVSPLEVPLAQTPTEQIGRYPAVGLFIERARLVKPSFALTDESAVAVAGIVAHVDGLPLAIELAASQVRLLTPSEIRSRLEDHLPLPPGLERGRPPRHRTMQAAIAWSYELLDEPERRLFARLSVFPGGCSLEAAEAVGDHGDLEVTVLEALAVLVSTSLIRRVDLGSDTRYAMLEPILEFADQRLRGEFDLEATHRRLAEYFLAFSDEAEPHLTAADQVPWLDRCERERANFRRAVEWTIKAGEADLGLRMAAALWRFWQQRGPMWEGRGLIDKLLTIEGGLPESRARALSAAGGLAWWAGDMAAASKHYHEALPLAQASGDRRLETEALYNLSFVVAWSDPGGPEAAEKLFRKSLALAEENGDRKGIAKARGGLATARAAAGDPGSAVPMLEEALAEWEEIGDMRELTDALVALGNARRRIGDREGARGAYLRALEMLVGAGNRQMSTGLLFLVTALEGELGRHERVARMWGAAESAREITGAVRPPVADRLIGDPVAAAREAIGDEAVERALAEGRAMSFEAIVGYAREDMATVEQGG